MSKTKFTLYFVTSIATVSLLVAVWFFNSTYSILGVSDVKMMIEDRKYPAITIPKTGEQYFNKWQCFDVKEINVLEGEIDYHGKRTVPYIQVDTNKRSIQFNIDPVINMNEKIIINKWKELISNQKAICIFGAYLQTDPDGTSVWYINKIKTKVGYWYFADERAIHRNATIGAQ